MITGDHRATARVIGIELGLFEQDGGRVLTGAELADLSDARLRESQTMALTTVILFQVLYLLNCRSLRDPILGIGLWTNPTVNLGIGVVLLLQAAFLYLPFMHVLFGTVPLGLDAWVEAMAAALILVPVIGAEKWWWQRRHRRSATQAAGRTRMTVR